MNSAKNRKTVFVKIGLLLPVLSLAPGCRNASPPTGNAAAPVANPAASTTSDNHAAAPSSSQPEGGQSAEPAPKELVKPAVDKGNVQGKVLFNDKPAANIEVTLSEKFSPFLGASGKSYTARTDKNGDYVIKNVPPKEYEGLTARVFDTNSVIFIKSGFVSAKSYSVERGKTLFVDPTHLFKNDLKVLSPKASATMPVKSAVFKWQAYPAAAYYKVSLYPDDLKNTSGVFQQRVDDISYQPDKPLPAGGYRIEVEAYNANDRKLSESPDQYKFRIAS